MWDSFSLVHDVNGTREAQYGMYYTKRKPVTLAALDAGLGI
jgi:hypothetical protein